MKQHPLFFSSLPGDVRDFPLNLRRCYSLLWGETTASEIYPSLNIFSFFYFHFLKKYFREEYFRECCCPLTQGVTPFFPPGDVRDFPLNLRRCYSLLWGKQHSEISQVSEIIFQKMKIKKMKKISERINFRSCCIPQSRE